MEARPFDLQRRPWDRRLHVEATVRAGVVYRPDDLAVETPEEITRRCRLRPAESV